MKVNAFAMLWAIASAIVMPASAQQQPLPIPAPSMFSIRSGETLLLQSVGSVTLDCTSLWDHFDSIDVLDGPSEVTLDFKPGNVVIHLNTTGKVCNDSPGGNVFLNANGITKAKEANLTFRVNYHMTSGKQYQGLFRFRLLMFPAKVESK